MKKTLALVLCLVMIVSLFAGCNKTNSDTGTDNGKSTGSDSQSTDPGSTATNSEVKYKEDIIIGISGKIIDLDPQENSNTQHNFFFRMVFDTPLDFNNETKELEPNICTEWSTDDAITYSFTLRDDVYFHNGEHMTAKDVKFTFDRGLDTSSTVSTSKLIKETKVVDEYHFTIELYKPNVDFPYQLTLPTASILCEKAVTEGVTDAVGIGSGPWVLDSYEFGDFIKFTRNDNFWGEMPKTKTVTLRYMPEDSARLVALETGEIDVCQEPDSIELDHVRDTKGLELQSYVSSGIQYLAMNYDKAPFNDRNLRLAMCYGIDRQELIDVTYNGEASICKSTWGWNEYGYNGGTEEYYEYNPELAKQYLAAAGYNESNPFCFTLSVSSGVRKTMGELIQAQMKKINVNVTINEMDTAGLSTSTTAGEHQSAVYGCGTNVFGDDISRLICPGTGVNKSHYNNPQVNELMQKAVAELDDAKRKDMYYEVQKILFEDGAYLPICTPVSYFAVKEGVAGIDYYPTSHHDFSDIYMIVD